MSLSGTGKDYSTIFHHASGHRAIDVSTINPQILKASYEIRGAMLTLADQLRNRLKSGEKLPFNELIACNIGNPFAVGKNPMTFPRQVVSCCENASLIESKDFPDEAKQRAASILDSLNGTFGAYTKSQGIDLVRNHIAEFIKNRDGYPCKPDDIYLTAGASSAATFMMTMLIQHPNVGIMTPFPTYPLYISEACLRNGKIVPIYASESKEWTIKIQDIQDSFNNALKEGIDVRAMVVINPGNPTGHVYDAETMRNIIDFCDQNNLLLIADEVYQDTIYNSEKPFISFKKMACQVKSNVQLVSLHSISKGFMGECGHRGGYMELYHFPESVKEQIYKMATFSLCPNTVGQVMVDTLVHPPTSEECSSIWNSEKQKYLDDLKVKSKRLSDTFNKLPGISCKEADGGWYLFPSLNLPLKAFEEAKNLRIGNQVMTPDFFWCYKLLMETGIIMVPGSGFGQLPGTHHFRSTFLPENEKFDALIEKLTTFQNKFMEEYA